MGATGESPVARSSEEDPTRPHVALAVEDIQEARRELEARGIRHWTIRGLVGDNSDQVFVPDPFNNIIELPPDRHLPLQPGHPRRPGLGGAASVRRPVSAGRRDARVHLFASQRGGSLPGAGHPDVPVGRDVSHA